MTAETEILQYLSDYKSKHTIKYQGVRLGFLGLPDFKFYKYQTLANRCSELKERGYIRESNGYYFITYKGEDFLDKGDHSRNILKRFTPEKTDKDPKDLLLLYDVSEEKKTERDWLRRQLINFNFVMIQRSVWVGPSPLPKDFTNYLKSVGLKDAIKTFKLAKGYNLSK